MTFVSTLFKCMLAVGVAEMGDKTQFLVIAMTQKYKLREILMGILISQLALNLIAVSVGTLIGSFVDPMLLSLLAGVLFIGFAVWTLFDSDDDDEEEDDKTKKVKKGFLIAIFTVAAAFFVAELGDKTQIAAMTFAADGGGITNAIAVFAGCTAGLFIADTLGALIGLFLGKKVPRFYMKLGSVVVFTVFGLIKMYPPLFERLGLIITIATFTVVGLFVLVGIGYKLYKYIQLRSKEKVS